MKKIIFIGKNWDEAKSYLFKEMGNSWIDFNEAVNKVISEIELADSKKIQGEKDGD